LSAHLAHGDLSGNCFGNCDSLCDDGNACTIDACDENEKCLADHPPVDCDDSDPCTNDTCDPENGCQSAPIVCSDGDNCTVDICNPANGECTSTPVDCGALGICLPSTGLCDFPCDGFTCDPIDQCHKAGTCVLSGGAPECLDGAPVDDGTPCDDGNAGTTDDRCILGICQGQVGDAGCPCWSPEELAGLRGPTPGLRGVCDKDFTGSGSVNRDSWTLSPFDSNDPITQVRTRQAFFDDGPSCTLIDRCSDGTCLNIIRSQQITFEQFLSCEKDVATSAADRGLILTQQDCGISP
jgi:hypothetical protein